MTNYEVIKNYSIDEMAEFIKTIEQNNGAISSQQYCTDVCEMKGEDGRCMMDDDVDPNCMALDDIECIKEWLNYDPEKLPDVPRKYYEKIVGNLCHEINELKFKLESITKCKDCVWYSHDGRCWHNSQDVAEDNFCSYGERRVK